MQLEEERRRLGNAEQAHINQLQEKIAGDWKKRESALRAEEQALHAKTKSELTALLESEKARLCALAETQQAEMARKLEHADGERAEVEARLAEMAESMKVQTRERGMNMH